MIVVRIYEVPNSYVSSGGNVNVINTFEMRVTDDDPFLNATPASDPGAPQNIVVTGQPPVDSYNFLFDDNIRWRNPGGWQNETVKTFQLVIDGQTRSFIMNNAGGEIAGMQPGSEISLQSYATFTPPPYSAFPCFVAGTLIETAEGLLPVEALRPGMRVRTRDHGPRPLLWVGASRLGGRLLAMRPDLGPVLVRAGAMGQGRPQRDLLVSPQHRILLSGAGIELRFGHPEMLAPAAALVGLPGIERAPRRAGVEYWHLLFDGHEILYSEGLETESFLPAGTIRDAMAPTQRAEIMALLPGLEEGDAPFPPARPILRAFEARSLIPRAA